MKKRILFALALAAAVISCAAEGRVFALATAGDVDSALAENIRARLEEISGAEVRLADAVPMEAGQTLEAIGRAAALALGENDHSVIVLTRAGAEQPQGVCLPDVRFAALNLSRLESGIEQDQDKLVRRATQEGLRVMAMLVGMSSCPFPLCVLVGYEKTEDLDRMSGSFCPPCQDRFTRIAREAGIRLVEKSEPAAEEAAAPAAEPAPEAAPVAAPVPAAEPAPAAAE